MFEIILFLIGFFAQQAVFPSTPFSNVGALPSSVTSFSLNVGAMPTTYSTLGATITYTYTITNTGTTTVGPFTINDSKFGMFSCGSSVGPGLPTSCTKPYSIVQADLDGGSITITSSQASYMGFTSNIPPPLTVTANQMPSISLSIGTVPTTFNMSGQNIAITYTVTNTGNVTLTMTVTVSDPKLSPVTCGTGSMAPMGTKTCTGSYLISSTDMTAGSVTSNPVTATTTFTGSVTATSMWTINCPTCGGPTINLSAYFTTGQSCDGVSDTTSAFNRAFADAPNHYNSSTGLPVILQLPMGTCAVWGTSFTTSVGICAMLAMPSNLSIQGMGINSTFLKIIHYPPSSAGCGNPFPLINYNYYQRSNYHNTTPYNTLGATAGSNTVQMQTPSDTSHFAVGDYVILYEREPNWPQIPAQCANPSSTTCFAPKPPQFGGPSANLQECDVCPSQQNKITAINPAGFPNGTIQFVHPWDRTYSQYSYPNTGGSNFISPPSTWNLTPTLGNVSYTTVSNGGVQNLTLDAAQPFNMNEVSDLTFKNINMVVEQLIPSDDASRTYNLNMQSNGVFYTLWDNVNWSMVIHGSANGLVGGEWWQDNSSNNTWQNSTWGASASNGIGQFSYGEYAHENFINNTFYLFAQSNGSLGFGGLNSKFDLNTVNQVGGTVNSANTGLYSDGLSVGCVYQCIQSNYMIYENGAPQSTSTSNNTFNNCATSSGAACLMLFGGAQLVQTNHVTATSGPAITYFGDPNATYWVIDNNTLSVASGSTVSLSISSNNNWKFTNNMGNGHGASFFNPTGGTCTVTGNMGFGSYSFQNSGVCTFNTNTRNLIPFLRDRFILAIVIALGAGGLGVCRYRRQRKPEVG
jgi:hypothetical protein